MTSSVDRPLRPEWAAGLIALLTPDDAAQLAGHPSWSGLLAAVDEGVRTGWEPTQLLRAALDLLRSGYPHTHTGHDLVVGLLRRVGLLTCLGDRAVTGDVDWMEGLIEPESTEPTTDYPDDNPVRVLRGRLLELNEQSAAFLVGAYEGSCA